MWNIFCDENLIYNPQLEDYYVTDAILDVELNKSGSFRFTIYPDHPNYDKLHKLKSTVTVYNDSRLYFRGRILADEVGWHNQREIQCEGELSFLLDSVQRPFVFPDDTGALATPEAYFTFLIQRHNAQVTEDRRFVIGECTVSDPNDYIARTDTEYSTTWALINEGLIDSFGGYLWVDSDESGNRRINYLADFDILGNQPIAFGSNLLTMTTERDSDDIATAIIPLGARNEETDERLTISAIADGTTGDTVKTGDYIYSIAGVEKYGLIFKPVTWDDVTVDTNLLARAKTELARSILPPQTTTLTAADLSGAGYDFNSFSLGTYIQVNDPNHETAHTLSSTYLVKKLSIDLQNPAQNALSVGDTTYSFTEANQKRQETVWKQVETNISLSESKVIRETEQKTNSAIQQASDSIRSWVSDEYYLKGETDELVSSVSTQIEQTAEGIRFDFSELQKNVDDVADGADAQFSEIHQYIRFENGNIILGESGSDLILQIQNDRISFLQSGMEVAYFSNQRFYVTDGEFVNSLQLGNFAFSPRSNGNLSFRRTS